jgi:hypothetical protein
VEGFAKIRVSHERSTGQTRAQSFPSLNTTGRQWNRFCFGAIIQHSSSLAETRDEPVKVLHEAQETPYSLSNGFMESCNMSIANGGIR